MKLSQLTYLVSIVLFCGSAIAALLYKLTKKEQRVLKKNEWVLFWLVVLAVPFTAVEFFALKWHAWHYYSEQTLDVAFGAQLETYIFAITVTIVLAVATLLSASRIDTARKKKNSSKRR